MKQKSVLLLISIVILICAIFYSCSKSPGIYIDIKNQAVCSCNGKDLGEIRIESDSTALTLKGTGAVIYFNKKNPGYSTNIYGYMIHDYLFKLKPRCNYQLKKINGYDRGQIAITFKTDSTGRIITALNTNCN